MSDNKISPSALSYRNIREITDDDLTALFNLYVESFPVEERRPVSSVLEYNSDPGIQYAMYAVYTEAQTPVALVSIWRIEDLLYVEHLAVDTTLRGSGIGGCIIDHLKAIAANEARTLVLEVEPPEMSSMAKRRIGFYRRAGLVLHDYDYTQLPYWRGMQPIKLRLMSTDNQAENAVLSRVERLLHQMVYNRVYDVET